MCKLINGKWIVKSIINSDENGAYDRLPRTFLNNISNNENIFKPETGRYHLYVSYACPWATRTLIYRKLKNLEDHISVSVVHPDMLENGWCFDTSFLGSTKDHLYANKFLREVYQKADPNITTSVTVPILWDKQTETIVNNESSLIIRILNSAFNNITNNHDDYYPIEIRERIDELNEIIYEHINNGVYKCGFATTQKAYDVAVINLFDTLDTLEKILDKYESVAKSTGASLADIIVLGGNLGIEIASGQSVPFVPGRGDASQEQTDIESFAVLEPVSDAFRNYHAPDLGTSPEEFMLDKAQLLGLTAPEMTVLVGGMRSLGISSNGYGLFTADSDKLSNDYFKTLLDMSVKWKPNGTGNSYEGVHRVSGEKVRTASRADLVFGSNSQLRAIVEVYAENDSDAKFVSDFIAAWCKVMNADRFDLQ